MTKRNKIIFKSIIDEIENLRRENDITQIELCEYLNICKQSYTAYKTYKVGLTFVMILKIAKVFNVKPSQLLMPLDNVNLNLIK